MVFSFSLQCGGEITRNLMLTSANQKRMTAFKVFSGAIKYLKDHLIDSVNKRQNAININASSIRWVITVPAIWSDHSKQFMREAAEEVSFSLIN